MAGMLDERESWSDKGMQHPSTHGVHASGVVVTDEPVCKYGAVDREGVLSMDMREAEQQGLVKMDVLGLRTMSVIQDCCDLAGIDAKGLYDLDWNEQAVLDRVFNADRVTGIFQFEGHAVRNLMKQVTVDKFDDLCALTSLARPGPLIGGAAGGWVKARNGEAVGDILHPSLEETHGVICYQEQFMAIARDIAGFDIPSVNAMRKAVAKKDPAKLASFREMFVNGTSAHFAT
jgi:DNA polymerase-3 subunit alpha